MSIARPIILTQPQNQGAGQSFDPNNPNDLSYLLLNQTDQSGDPNWQQNISDYNAITGLPVAGRYQGYNAAKMLIPSEYYNLANQMGFYTSLQPQEHAMAYQLLNHLTHPELMSQEYANAETGNLPAQNQQDINQLLSAGAGQGTKEGVVLHNQNAVNRNIATFNANLYSPEGEAQRAQAGMQLIGSQAPSYGNLQTLHNIELGTPRNPTGADIAGNIVGDFLGSGAFGNGGLFGKSSGGK